MLRRLLKTSAAYTLHATRMDRLIGSYAGCRHRPVVVCHHRVVDDVRKYPESIPAMLISEKSLDQHLNWLARHFRLVSLDELGQLLVSVPRLERPVAAVTFDDGYRDVYYHAFPLLKKFGIPAAVFVVSGLVSTSQLQLHDRLYLALKAALAEWKSCAPLVRLLGELGISPGELQRRKYFRPDPLWVMGALFRTLAQHEVRQAIGALEERFEVQVRHPEHFLPLTWEMLAEMQKAGITVGSHTRSHALLPNESPQKVNRELGDSRRQIEEKLGIRVTHLAYPDGRFNLAVLRATAAAGYRFAYTTCRHRHPEHPCLTIPRLHLWESSCLNVRGHFSPAILSCQVNGIFGCLAPCRQDHGLAGLQAESTELKSGIAEFRKVTAL